MNLYLTSFLDTGIPWDGLVLCGGTMRVLRFAGHTHSGSVLSAFPPDIDILFDVIHRPPHPVDKSLAAENGPGRSFLFRIRNVSEQT